MSVQSELFSAFKELQRRQRELQEQRKDAQKPRRKAAKPAPQTLFGPGLDRVPLEIQAD